MAIASSRFVDLRSRNISPSLAELTALVNTAMKIEDIGYYPPTWQDLQEAISYAVSVVRSHAPEQGQILLATQMLISAIAELREWISINFAAGEWGDDLEFSRASTATYWGPSGSLLEAAVDETRIQHDPLTGETLGLLIEPQSTNLISRSNEVEWLAYNPASTTVRVDSVGQALGVPISALECVEPGTVRAANSGVFSNGLVPATISAVVKAVGGGRIFLAFSRASLRGGIYFDPSTEEFEVINDDRITDYGFERLRDGFYRIWATRRPGPSAGAAGWVHYTIGLTDADVGDRLLVTLLGSADDPAPSSPIPTSGSPVTRAADNAAIDLSDVFNPDEGTLRITAQVPEGEVVSSLGGMQVVSDSDEKKTYRMTYRDYTGVPTVSLGNGVHSKLEYIPEAQS